MAYIDDASRLCCHASFSFKQDFITIRDGFKDAVLKRGVPRMLYTDNAKVYRSGRLAAICASIGCTLLHAEPFTPNGKGEIERFFRTVRMRFLIRLEPEKLESLEELNLRFWQWLEEDYQRKVHSALEMTPLDYFMSQADQIKLFSDPGLLDEHFLLRAQRKVNHDATLSLDKILYETDASLAGSRLEVRYEPQWLDNPARPVFLYQDGAKVGEARQVNLVENASSKRKGRGRPVKEEDSDMPPATHENSHSAVSFTAIFTDEKKVSNTEGAGEV